ncbi:UNVERIFIED_CONTAM: hypothetical protein GTU68_007688 [Idotea baltica]|nr:hypothetical protein [Idotea baltica]
MMDCKKALVEANGDEDQAVEILKKKVGEITEKRSNNATNEGRYFTKATDDGGAVLVEIACESAPVAGSESLAAFASDIAMHTAAMRPEVANIEDVDQALVQEERDRLTAEAKATGKPDNIIDKIVDGRMSIATKLAFDRTSLREKTTQKPLSSLG